MPLLNRTTRLRLKRRVRYSRRKVEDMGYQAEDQFERHLIRRLTRLFDVRRFIAGWLGLLFVLGLGVALQTQALNNYYQQLQPVAGGLHAEGIVGSFTNANPLYATSLTDTTVSRLLFSGLLKYDQENRLVGDLAQSWQIDETGKVYTFTLKPNLTWHDGESLTAEDVVFTYQTAQNADAKSPLFYGLRGVQVKAVNETTVSFTLSNALAPFIYSLTTGIIPKHSLQDINPVQLRSASFNTTKPIGSGPFMWSAIEISGNTANDQEQQIDLRAFDNYHITKPQLPRFLINTYTNEDEMIKAFKEQKISAIVGLDRLPDSLASEPQIHEYSAPLTAATMVFFNTESELLKDAKVRQALVHSVDVPSILSGLSYPVVSVDQPLLRKQLGYDKTLKQLQLNTDQANKLLDSAGWVRAAADQPRSKGPTELKLKFLASNNADYSYLTRQLQKAWQSVGVEAEVELMADADLQSAITGRGYDALLYGISLGTDPDVFAFWHSTQASPVSTSRLNFSNYKSTPADKALEAGRSRVDPELRAAKYKPFLQAWQTDAPALALYQPRFLYITRGKLYGFNSETMHSASDRFAAVHEWMVREAPGMISE